MRLTNLEFLRFFAALWVVATHSNGYVVANAQGQIFGAEFFTQGGYGVDLFFVISGFVIGLTQLSAPKTPRRFIINRLIRIVPTYWIVTICTAIFVWSASRFGFRSEVFEDFDAQWVIASLGFVSQPVLGLGPLVYQGWTLEYEMFFYLAVALGVLAFRAGKSQLLLGAVIVVAAVLLVPDFSPRALQFVFGLIAVWAFIRIRDVWGTAVPGVLLVLGLGLAALEIWFIDIFVPEWLTLGIAFSSIVLSSALLPQLRSNLWNSLGAASYAVYLWQVLTIPIIFLSLSTIWGWTGNENLIFWIVLLITQISGMLFERFIDSPLRNRIRSLVT